MASWFNRWILADHIIAAETIITAVLRDTPNPPRRAIPYWYPLQRWRYWVAATIACIILIAVGLLAPSIISAWHNQSIWSLRGHLQVLILAPFAIPLLLYIIIRPVRAWQTGLMYGHSTIVSVRSIKPRFDDVAHIAHGTWDIWMDGQWVTRSFSMVAFEPHPWIADLREGDRIRVLLHPTKPKVLLAYGP